MLTAKNVSSVRACEYFVQGYYQHRTSRWYGHGAHKLGLVGQINDEQVFNYILNGLSPDGNQKLNSRTLSSSFRRAGTDFTFSSPKSVSLTALVAGDERLKLAHQIAVEKTLSLIEQRYAHTRVTIDKHRQTISTGNLVIAEFDHIETRELDPHLHTHCLVMNMTQDTDGRWYSYLNDAIFRHKKHLGMVYQSYLANEVQKLGYEIEPRLHGQFEIKGYNEHDLVEFSKRRQQILAAARDNSHWVEREKAWGSTRKNKQLVQPEDLKRKWQQEALVLGINFVKPGQPKTEHQQQPVSISNLSDAIAHCSERNVAFYTEDLERFILEQNLATDLTGLESLISNQKELVCLSKSERHFTTQTAINREIATIRLMEHGQNKVNSITHPDIVSLHLENTTLNAGQRQAVHLASTTLDQFIAWQGVAGAGKTSALKTFKVIANTNGYTVKGFAPNSQAAKVLGEELGVQTETVAKLLVTGTEDWGLEETSLQYPIPNHQYPVANQIWVVDEAGLLSAKDAHTLLLRATSEKARVIFVGDVKQLSAVEAGNPFKSLQQAGIKTAYLYESLRQRTPQLKLAVDLIAHGRIEDGFARLDENGHIQTVTPEEKIDAIAPSAVLKAIAAEYMNAASEQREQTLILTGTHQTRLALTLAIRNRLQAEGSLGDDVTTTQLKAKNLTKIEASYTHNFDIGDVVIPIRHYKRLGLRKGERYEVFDKTDQSLTLVSADGNLIEVGTHFEKTVYQRQQIAIAVGDRLRWTKNDRLLGRRNGQEFVVSAISGNCATIQYLDNAQSETIALKTAQHFDYALVNTTYSSQGKTAFRVLAAPDYTTSAENFYVAVSRAKYELKIFTDDKQQLLRLAQISKAQQNPSNWTASYRLNCYRQQYAQHQALEILPSSIGSISSSSPQLTVPGGADSFCSPVPSTTTSTPDNQILQAINQMNNQDLIQFANDVRKYFHAKTSKPPLQTDKQNILHEIDKLSQHINDLWLIQEQLQKQIHSMQYNPFQVFGRKYSQIQAQSLKTLESLSQALARKEQFEQQLTDWEQHHKDHQAWKASPNTEQMRDAALILDLPQIQQRLTAAKNEIEIQRQQQLADYEQSRAKQMEQQQQYHYHRRGRTR